jgi:signal transduction histidine kinase
VGAQAREALGTLRDLARGIYPPALADRGLAAALEAHLAKACPGVRLSVDAATATARFAPQTEAAVYFCCLEALQNRAKHAGNAPATVRLALDNGWLAFTVADRGPGFDVATTHMGSGLQNMADRLAALDGMLEVRSQPGQGTTVQGRVPARPGGSRAQQDHPVRLAVDRVAHNAAEMNSGSGS